MGLAAFYSSASSEQEPQQRQSQRLLRRRAARRRAREGNLLRRDSSEATAVAPGEAPRSPAGASSSPSSSLSPWASSDVMCVTRGVEWGTVLLGYEQANRYTVLDGSGQQVLHVAEETDSIASAVGRQVLRRRRNVRASVLDPANGDVLAVIRRPFYLVTSNILIQDGQEEDASTIGEVVQRFSIVGRHYDLYVSADLMDAAGGHEKDGADGQAEMVQFARIRSGFLAWYAMTESQKDVVSAGALDPKA